MSAIELKDYILLEPFDTDEISVGYKAKNRETDELVFVRKYRQEIKDQFYQNYVNPLIQNITGIVKCIGYENSDDNIIIITEYMNNGFFNELLYKYLKTNGHECEKMNPTIRSKIIFGISAILKRVHHRNLIHLNLQPKSIFLDSKLEPKINNFGIHFSKIEGHLQIGTPYFWSPELLLDSKYDSSADVYSFAFIIYSMFSNEIKFDHPGQISTRYQMKKIICEGKRLVRPKSIPDCYWELINRCWDQNPEKRPTFDEITEILRNDKFAIDEFGMKTNLDELHEYQKRIDSD